MTEKTFIKFTDAGTSPSGKTKRWTVQASSGGDSLGAIYWYAPWRKYTFAAQLSLYDDGCLRQIADFIQNETMKHKEE
jgi:hypothetical protein